MVARLKIELNGAQEKELRATRDSHAKAYMRERASAVLKVAGGVSARQVAEHGLLKRHEPETVSRWIRQYLAAGLAGWAIKGGRGRKAKFFPPQP